MKKIMIVEDSNLMKAVITNFIKKENGEYNILTASTGEEGVSKYKAEKPDLVFMDIKMPGMDGITALGEIMSYDPKAKVIMCTALKETEQEEKAKKLGAKGYIKKPFGKDDITNALNANLN